MKTRIFLLVLLMAPGFLISCSSDDDNVKQEASLTGVWHLKNVRGGLLGIDIDYSLGEVRWDFNTNTLVVVNNIITTGPEDIYAGLDSGTYNFEVVESGGVQTLFINDTERGVITVTDTVLQIDDGLAADGFVTEFVR
jgi:hypothetical protein